MYDKIHPVIPRRDDDESLRLKDSPQDWVTAFIQYLYPSSGLVGLVASTRPSDFTNKMDVATVGRVMQVICTVDHSNKKRLAGAILAALDPTQFLPKYKKQTKNLKTDEQKEKVRNRLWDSLGNAVLKVNQTTKKQKIAPIHTKRSAEKAAVIAYLITEALLESEKPGAIYPPHIVETALTAWVWKKASSKAELLPCFEAMPKLLADNVKLDAGGKIIGFIEPGGNITTTDDWNQQVYTKQQYVDFKEGFQKNGPTAELVKELTDSPEFSAFIGNGYYIYDVKLPPKRTYGSAKHPSLKGQKPDTFPDCGSTSLRSFFEMVLFHPQTRKTRIFDLTILKNLAEKYKVDVNFGDEAEEGFIVPEFSKNWPGLKQLIWFFMKYPKPTKAQDATNDWALVTSDFADVTYLKGKSQAAPVCEINAGIANMMKVVAKLIPDPGLISTEAYVNKSNADILTKLCEILSTVDKKLTWESPEKNQTLKADTGVKLTFSVNDENTFTWDFLRGHFDVTPIVKAASHFQLGLQDDLVKVYNKGLPVYLVNFYADPKNLSQLSEAYPKLMWPLIYGDLYDEATKKYVITYLFENKKREHYPLAWRWMNQFPTDDRRIQLFMVGTLLKDKDWFENLPIIDPIKQQAEGYLSKVNVEESDEIIKGGFVGLLKWAVDQKIIILDAKTIDEKEWLHLAAESEALALVKLLLDNGANIEAIYDGRTPLHQAVKVGHLATVKLLLDRGANIEATNNGGETSLLIAALKRNVEIVKLLLDREANIEARDEDGFTPLNLVANTGNLNIVKLLLDRGANIEARNKNDIAPLYMAAFLGGFDIVKELTESGAIIWAKNKRNETVYDISKTPEIKDYLKNVMDNFKYPPEKTEEGGKALEYLKYLVNLSKDKPDFPPRLLTYWANQTLSGLQYGVRKTYPTNGEMPLILEALAMSASGVPYGSDDRWMAWSIFRNKNGNPGHMKNIYTFIRYAQMRLAKLPDGEIMANLAKDEKALNDITVGTFGNVKAQFDPIIEKYK